MTISSDLKSILGNDLILDETQMIPYVTDASPFHGEMPVAVAIPANTDQISKLLEYCQQHSVPVVARGGGTSLTGSSVSVKGSVVISMSRFNRILETALADMYVIAEPGVRVEELNAHLASLGFMYPPDPASALAATVGGTISTNAGGLRASMYGTTKNWILGLEVVLPNGKIIRTGGKVLKRTLGYDLTALMVGAEGSLGIVTKAVLKIWPVPASVGRILAYFDRIEKVGIAVSALKANGITPLIAEFLDRATMDLISSTFGLKFPEKAEFMIMVDVASTVESIDSDLERAKMILSESGPIEISTTKDSREMEKMYVARKGAYSSLLNKRTTSSERVVIGDIVVPASRLPDALKDCEQAARNFDVRVALFGHIADGNIHANVFSDMDSEESVKRVEGYQNELGRIALKYEGSVSAEHGIGIEKKSLLKMELESNDSQYALEIMKGIRKVFDPNGIMNRGKMFD